jgi:hypothetical protein
MTAAPWRRGPTHRSTLRELWGWLCGTGYRPERHYMRGGTACR